MSGVSSPISLGCHNRCQNIDSVWGSAMRSPAVKSSEDVVPLGDMKINPGGVVRRVEETGRPVCSRVTGVVSLS